LRSFGVKAKPLALTPQDDGWGRRFFACWLRMTDTIFKALDVVSKSDIIKSYDK